MKKIEIGSVIETKSGIVAKCIGIETQENNVIYIFDKNVIEEENYSDNQLTQFGIDRLVLNVM